MAKPKIIKTPGCELYQQLVDRVFGSGAINIKLDVDNKVIGTLKHVDEYSSFKANFENRLERLKAKFEGTASYADLKQTVAQVADSKNWEGAYAELVAYDVLSNDYLPDHIEVNKTLPVTESFAGELGGKETNEDGFINEYDLYFDVKILADTVGAILDGIIREATKQAEVADLCDILPEYPLDDDDEDYRINRRAIMEELRDYLKTHKPTKLVGRELLRCTSVQRLNFRIQWGSGVNSAESEYDPYRHAEETRHMMVKRYTKKFMKAKPFMLVMVNFPWYNRKVNSFIKADEFYYRSLARRTFCEYKNLSTLMSAIIPKFYSGESVYEVSQHLSGIIFIDDHSIENDSYSCHIYMNPNAKNPVKYGESYLKSVVNGGDSRSLYDNLVHDNY